VSVASNGKLTRKAEVKMTHGTSYLSIDGSGQYLMTASYSEGTVDVYKLDKEGIPTGPVFTKDEGRKFAHSILQAPNHNLICVPYVKENGTVYQYSLDLLAGRLIPLNPAQAFVPKGVGPRHQAYHPTKPFVYFSNEQHIGASAYRIGDSGTLAHLQVCDPGDLKPGPGLSASDCKITPDGRFLFTGQRAKPDSGLNGVNRYRVNDDGTLTWLGRTDTDTTPWGLMVTPDGKHLMVTASTGGTLTRFVIDEAGGLKKLASVSWGKSIRSIGVVSLDE
jgi:6-phosphogluconolactonase